MKKLNLKLLGRDGNVFGLIGYFIKEAKRAGWAQEDIDKKLKEVKSGDYYHALKVLMEV